MCAVVLMSVPTVGAAPKHRLWTFSKQTVLSDTFPGIVQPHEAYCFRFPKSYFREGARSFDEFKKQEHASRHMMILYQAVFEMIRRLVEDYQRTSRGDSDEGMPIQVFLECAPAKSDADAPNGNTMHPLEQLHEDSREFDFLLGDPKIAEYRIWVFIINSKLNLGDALKKMIEDNAKAREVGPRRAPPGADQILESYHAFPEHEKFRMITSRGWWQRYVCDVARGYDTTNNEEVNADMLRKEIDDLDSKLHPRHLFGALVAFQFAPPIVEERFANYKNYCENSTHTYRFPVPSNVLRISVHNATPWMMFSKFFPDYQKKQEYALAVERERYESALSLNRWIQNYIEDPTAAETMPPDNVNLYNLDDVERAAFIEMTGGLTPEQYAEEQADRPQTQDPREHWEQFRAAESYRTDNPVLEHTEPLDPHQLREELPEELAGELLDRMIKNGQHSAYEELADQAAPYQKIIDQTSDNEERRLRYELHRRWVFTEFEARCMSSESEIGDVCRVMMRWREKQPEDINVKVVAEVFDPEMSVFGNMVIRHMDYMENYLMFAHTHKSFYTIWTGALDAYRHSFGLHWNNISCGPGSRSKSFMYDTIVENSIPGTVRTYTFQTKRADAIDGDQNDWIDIQHETPLSQFEEHRGKFNEEEAHFKERLTSQIVRAKVFEKLPDGRRTNRTSVSQCIGSWNGATNDGPEHLGEAFVSRMNWEWVKETSREYKDIIDVMSAAKSMSIRETAKKAHIQREFRRLQFIHCMVEKLIWVGGLRAPTLKACNIIFGKINEYMRTHCGASIHTRTIQRMEILARSLVITLAVEYLYNIPGHSKYYGKPFHISQLEDMDELLHDTEEIAYFVLGLQKEQFLDPTEKLVLKELKKHHDVVPPHDRFKQRFETPSFGRPRMRGGFNRQYRMFRASPGGNSPSFMNAVARPSMNFDSRSEDDDEQDDAEDESLESIQDYNYFRIPYHSRSLPKKIHDEINQEARPSLQAIQGILRNLSNKSLRSHPYAYDKDTQTVSRDTSQPERNFSAMQHDEHYCYVHASLFEEDFLTEDTLLKAIRSTFHIHTIRGKVIFGQVYDETRHPNIFQVLHTSPDPNHRMKTNNPLYMATHSDSERVDPTRRVPHRFVDANIDLLSVINRFDVLSLDKCKDGAVIRHHPRTRDNIALKQLRQSVSMRYPGDYVRKIEKERKKWAEKSKQLSQSSDPNALESASSVISLGTSSLTPLESMYAAGNSIAEADWLADAKKVYSTVEEQNQDAMAIDLEEDNVFRFEETPEEERPHKRKYQESENTQTSAKQRRIVIDI